MEKQSQTSLFTDTTSFNEEDCSTKKVKLQDKNASPLKMGISYRDSVL